MEQNYSGRDNRLANKLRDLGLPQQYFWRSNFSGAGGGGGGGVGGGWGGGGCKPRWKSQTFRSIVVPSYSESNSPREANLRPDVSLQQTRILNCLAVRTPNLPLYAVTEILLAFRGCFWTMVLITYLVSKLVSYTNSVLTVCLIAAEKLQIIRLTWIILVLVWCSVLTWGHRRNLGPPGG